MNDLISRQAAIDDLKCKDPSQIWDTADIEVWVNALPSAQPERKKGKWICWYEEIKSDPCIEYIPHCKCSECGTEYDSHTVKFINFCSYCGADMKGEQDE